MKDSEQEDRPTHFMVNQSDLEPMSTFLFQFPDRGSKAMSIVKNALQVEGHDFKESFMKKTVYHILTTELPFQRIIH